MTRRARVRAPGGSGGGDPRRAVSSARERRIVQSGAITCRSKIRSTSRGMSLPPGTSATSRFAEKGIICFVARGRLRLQLPPEALGLDGPAASAWWRDVGTTSGQRAATAGPGPRRISGNLDSAEYSAGCVGRRSGRAARAYLEQRRIPRVAERSDWVGSARDRRAAPYLNSLGSTTTVARSRHALTAMRAGARPALPGPTLFPIYDGAATPSVWRAPDRSLGGST